MFFTGKLRSYKHPESLQAQVRKRAMREIHFSDLLRLLQEKAFDSGPVPRRLASYFQGYVQHLIRERDHGICANCGFPTLALAEAITWYAAHRHQEMEPVEEFKAAIGRRARRWPKRLWDMDHIRPVSLGGELLAPSNLRTLCLQCHPKETAKLRRWPRKKKPSAAYQQKRQERI